MKNSNSLVLWDVGGVLLELNYSGIYEAGAKLTKTTSAEFKQRYLDSKLELNTLTGEISDKQYQQRLKSMIGNPQMSRTELERFVKCCWGKEITSVVDLKERVYFEANTSVGIFSNMNKFAFEYLSRTYPRMLQTFNPQAPVIYSYLAGDVKPGDAMYKEAETQAQKIKADRIILIEDKESYLENGINTFGWNGILFTPYIDSAEAIRAEKGHNKVAQPNKNLKIANSIIELEQALKEFGIPLK